MGSGGEDSVDVGLSRLSISPIAAGAQELAVAERGTCAAAPATTFASITGGGAFTSPKKTAVQRTSLEPASSSASTLSAASAVSAATTANVTDAESLARIQLHNIDLQRRVERLQMSMKVNAVRLKLAH